MAKMTDRMKQVFEKVPVAVLATATGDGTPNAVPMAAKKIIDDETILLSDQYFNKTLANMKSNPKASVTFWEKTEGYQFKGTIIIETSGERLRRNGQMDRGTWQCYRSYNEIQGRRNYEN